MNRKVLCTQLKTKHFIGNGEINIRETEVNVLNDE